MSATARTTKCRSTSGPAARTASPIRSRRRRTGRAISIPPRTTTMLRPGPPPARPGRAATPSRCGSRSTRCAAARAASGGFSSPARRRDGRERGAHEAARGHLRARLRGLAERRGIDVAHRRRHRRPDHRHLVARGDDPPRLLERRGGSAEYRPERVPALLQRDAPLLLARDQRVRQQLLRLPRHHRTLHARHPDAQARLRARRNARAGDVRRIQLDRRRPHRHRSSAGLHHAEPRLAVLVRPDLGGPRRHAARPHASDVAFVQRPHALAGLLRLRLGPRDQRPRRLAGPALRRRLRLLDEERLRRLHDAQDRRVLQPVRRLRRADRSLRLQRPAQ